MPDPAGANFYTPPQEGNAAYESHKLMGTSVLRQCVECVRHWIEELLINFTETLPEFE